MRTLHSLLHGIALATALAAPALAAGNHDHSPRHGGVVAAGKEADYELVATATALHLYVSDHGKPLDLAGASARLTLLAAGGAKQEVALQPGNGRLEATGNFQATPGTQVIAVVSARGKTLGTARFRLK